MYLSQSSSISVRSAWSISFIIPSAVAFSGDRVNSDYRVLHVDFPLSLRLQSTETSCPLESCHSPLRLIYLSKIRVISRNCCCQFPTSVRFRHINSVYTDYTKHQSILIIIYWLSSINQYLCKLIHYKINVQIYFQTGWFKNTFNELWCSKHILLLSNSKKLTSESKLHKKLHKIWKSFEIPITLFCLHLHHFTPACDITMMRRYYSNNILNTQCVQSFEPTFPAIPAHILIYCFVILFVTRILPSPTWVGAIKCAINNNKLSI